MREHADRPVYVPFHSGLDAVGWVRSPRGKGWKRADIIFKLNYIFRTFLCTRVYRLALCSAGGIAIYARDLGMNEVSLAGG